MKKRSCIAILLSAAFLLGLGACGRQPRPGPGPASTAPPPVTATPAPTDVPKPTTEELRAAYDAAVEAFGWFEVDMASLFGDQTDVRETEEGRYYLIQDSRFDTWDTLEAYLYSLFDVETVLRLPVILTLTELV